MQLSMLDSTIVLIYLAAIFVLAQWVSREKAGHSKDAKDYFLNFQLPAGSPTRKKNALRRNQFGAWVSGPVLLPKYNGKDKTFWSFNYEGVRQTLESVQQAFWFPEEFRRGNSRHY